MSDVTAAAAGDRMTFAEVRQFVAEGEVAGVADDAPVSAGLAMKVKLRMLAVDGPQAAEAAPAVAAPRPVPVPPPPAAM